jgi:nicotinamidase-related amidase
LAEDAVTDDGQEMWNILQAARIADLILMGVHANICVLSRWYGIRQLVYLGKRPVLCGDLTDSFHRDPRGHEWGTAQVLAHIQRYWCPVLTSAQLLSAR